MAREDLHEDFSRQGEVKSGSDRAFGLVFAGVFALVGLWPLLGGGGARAWALAAAAVFLVVALARPRLLAPLNRLWFRFGLLLHTIVNPVIMGLVYFTTVVPIGLIMRLGGKDPLGLKPDRTSKSYWVHRDPPGPEPDTMRNQF